MYPASSHQDSRNEHDSQQVVPAYYTLGQPVQFPQRQSSPLRNPQQTQADYKNKLEQASSMKDLMSRADLALQKSSKQL